MESDKGWEWSLGHSNRHWGVGCSVTKSCPTLYDPMNCSLLGFPVLHYLLEDAQTHICWVGDYLTISSSVTPFSFCPQSFPASGFFPMSQLFASGGQSIGASTLASVLPVNIQGRFSLRLTGLISFRTGWFDLLAVQGTFKSLFSTTVQKHQLFGFSLTYGPTLTYAHDYWKNLSFDYINLCWQSDVWLCFLRCCLGLS